MEITYLLPTPARLDKGALPPGKGLEGSFEASNSATEKLAPPGAAPPLTPARWPMGEEGAKLEPNALPQIPDFFPNAETNGLGTPIAGFLSDGDKKTGTGPSDDPDCLIGKPKGAGPSDPDCRIGFDPITIQLFSALGPIVVAMPPKPATEANSESGSKPVPADPAPPIEVGALGLNSDEAPMSSAAADLAPTMASPDRMRKHRTRIEPMPPETIGQETKSKGEMKRHREAPMPPVTLKPAPRPGSPPVPIENGKDDAPPMAGIEFAAVRNRASAEEATNNDVRKLAAAQKAEIRDALLLKTKANSTGPDRAPEFQAAANASAETLPTVGSPSTPAKGEPAIETKDAKPTAAEGVAKRPNPKESAKLDGSETGGQESKEQSSTVRVFSKSDPVPADAPSTSIRFEDRLGDGAMKTESTGVAASADRSKIELTDRQSSSMIRQVADRLEALAVSHSNRKVTIRLEPESLGSITLVVRHEKSNVSAEVFASDDSVRAALTANRPSLVSSLEQRGIQLNSMTVGNELPQGSGREEQAMREVVKEHANLFAASSDAPPLTLEAMRGLSRKTTGVDLWI